jgi:hypothetical protein
VHTFSMSRDSWYRQGYSSLARCNFIQVAVRTAVSGTDLTWGQATQSPNSRKNQRSVLTPSDSRSTAGLQRNGKG